MTVVVYGVLLVIGVVLLAVTTVRVSVGGLTGGRERARRSNGKSPQRILEERYAADELTTEDYEHRLRVLKDGKA